MINPNGDDFTKNDPTSGSAGAGEQHISPGGAPRFQTGGTETAPTAGTSENWREKREKAEFFLRENPIPTILGALTIGIAIGLAIRFASEEDEPEIETKALGNVDLSFLTMPFLWPFFKTAKSRAEDAAEVVKDRVSEGVDRLKKVDVDDYVKPLRKKMRKWTR
ncbi:MAG TPA: hypothetical protein VGC85_11085 [Chthoniobacterales bacterium]